MYCQLEQAIKTIDIETEKELTTLTQKLILRYSECIQKENQDCTKIRHAFFPLKQKIYEHKDQLYKCIAELNKNQSFQQCIDVFTINQTNTIKKGLKNIDNDQR